jgi:hypothetical protein
MLYCFIDVLNDFYLSLLFFTLPRKAAADGVMSYLKERLSENGSTSSTSGAPSSLENNSNKIESKPSIAPR